MNRALQRLDSIHSRLVSTIAAIDEPQFSRSPGESEWSIAEIVHHLCLVEEKVTEELERQLANPPRRVGFLRKFIPTSIVASRVIRAKSPRAVNPLNPPARAELLANYDAARNRLKNICSTHGEERFRNIVFKHPIFGDIDGPATISFVGYHELRHYKQIREVIKKLSV
jgi:hypothetical protein